MRNVLISLGDGWKLMDAQGFEAIFPISQASSAWARSGVRRTSAIRKPLCAVQEGGEALALVSRGSGNLFLQAVEAIKHEKTHGASSL